MLLIFLSPSVPTVSAAPLTAGDEGKMVGKWLVTGGGTARIYDITAGRNVRIEGSGRRDRHGRMNSQPDGSYIMKLDDDSILRMTYTPATDALVVEYYRGKKDAELGLKPMWKVSATRKDQ